MDSWIGKQQSALLSKWEGSIDQHYPDEASTWSDPAVHYEALLTKWNTLDAAGCIDWANLTAGDAVRVLDLGAGTGWLSAYLSKLRTVAQVDALDASERNLVEMLPNIVNLMDGDMDKIRPVLGLFEPLPVPADSYELIVSSSAVHHAADLVGLLAECRRVLTTSGTLVILNETPLTTMQSLRRAGRIAARVALQIARGRYERHSPSVTSGGVIYDPFLGDRSYSLAQWHDAFKQSGWEGETIETPLTTYRSSAKRDSHLTHFLLRKSP